MKDIGKSRRKDKRNRQVSLELPESIGETSTSSESELPFRCATGQQGTFQKFELAGDGPTPASNAEVKSCASFYPLDSALYFQPSDSEHAAPQYLQQIAQDCSHDSRDFRTLAQSSSSIERLGSGRGNPFARYPIPMKGQMRELLDEGASCVRLFLARLS